MPVGCELILTATQISIPIKDKGGAAQLCRELNLSVPNSMLFWELFCEQAGKGFVVIES
jgi:hypothetical protein